jgi:glycosyltransferase involved in cell wall biosynthesis
MSLFEGYEDDAVISIGRSGQSTPVSVTLYDLIPMVRSDEYLKVQPRYEAYYFQKIDDLKRASLLLAISESSRREAIDRLRILPDSVVNVSAGVHSRFQPLSLSPAHARQVLDRFSLTSPFLLCVGGFDARKNLPRLIRAYGRLPARVRAGHLLVFTGELPIDRAARLKREAESAGLDPQAIRFTGYVNDEELVQLYNLCKAAVLPSLHEGFGLPALEAMSCGRAIVAGGSSSLLEVIGRQDALFDPLSEAAIAQKLLRVLTDDEFRAQLEQHGLEQAKKFSWDKSARLAIAAFERLHAQSKALAPSLVSRPARRLKLAYVSPLPPDHSGIADYSADLLPELARHYEIEAISPQGSASDHSVGTNVRIRDEDWFRSNVDGYDRVLYHFGNSPFHQHMFRLLDDIPGVVVLHDFFLYSVIRHMAISGVSPAFWTANLYHSHGYQAVMHRFHDEGIADGAVPYPCNLTVLQNARGIIVHSEISRCMATQWYGPGAAERWVVIPSLVNSGSDAARLAARRRLSIGDGDFIVCSFGIVAPTKLSHRLLTAYLESELAKHSNHKLIFVGQNHGGEYGARLLASIRAKHLSDRVYISGWIDDATFRDYLASADVAVQLRTMSRGETSRAVLQCMGSGVATIVNAHGGFNDLADDGVWKLPDEFADSQLVQALESLWRDDKYRRKLGDRARQIIRTEHAPPTCADKYADAIERFYRDPAADVSELTKAVGKIDIPIPVPDELPALARDIAQSLPPSPRPRQLLVDVSELIARDRKDGIHRVVRRTLREWLTTPPSGFRVEPVFAPADRGYVYARRFTLELLGCPVSDLDDEPMEYQSGDVFVGLDWAPGTSTAQRSFYQRLRRYGVSVQFLVYDLLPIQMPQYFPEGMAKIHGDWLEVVAESDGAICISKTVAEDLQGWIQKRYPTERRPFRIVWFHNGADIDSARSTKGLPSGGLQVLKTLRANPSFLMVGTIEPRKGHAQALSAFERIWREGVNANLVIVGNEGWKHVPDDMRRNIPGLVRRLRQHPELGRRLFWLEGVSDEYLDKIYASSTCLIAAAEGEGFGLPLIEAAQHKLPIICRDIPAFREIGGNHAFYFQGLDPGDMAEAVKLWMQLRTQGHAPSPDALPWLTWSESAANLQRILMGDPTDEDRHSYSSRKGS